jgi:hypothetical protein
MGRGGGGGSVEQVTDEAASHAEREKGVAGGDGADAGVKELRLVGVLRRDGDRDADAPASSGTLAMPQSVSVVVMRRGPGLAASGIRSGVL